MRPRAELLFPVLLLTAPVAGGQVTPPPVRPTLPQAADTAPIQANEAPAEDVEPEPDLRSAEPRAEPARDPSPPPAHAEETFARTEEAPATAGQAPTDAAATPPAEASVPSAENAAPAARPVASSPPSPAPSGRARVWPYLIGLMAAAGAALLLLLRRRRVGREGGGIVPDAEPIEVRADDAPASPARAEAAPLPGPRLELTFRPVRAGLNLLGATAEGAFTIRNAGDAAVEGVRLGVLLLPAHAEQDSLLAEAWAGPVTRPVVPPFALAPDEERTVPHTAALPGEAIAPIDAGGRPMFVPVVAASLTWERDGGGEGQIGRAWVVGVERPGAPKLQPFWLDEAPRNRTDVAARPHGAGAER